MKTFIDHYASYNEWANAKLVIWLATVDPEILNREIPSSFGSMDSTLQHILRAQQFWWLFITEQDTSKFSWAARANEVEKTIESIGRVSTQMKVSFTDFNNDELHENLYLNMPWGKNNLRRFEYMVHVINHSTYHRGQIVTMGHGLGIAEHIPNTDYTMFLTK